jgi:hypothetical protein
MNKPIISKRSAFAMQVVADNQALVSVGEKSKIVDGQLELVDELIVVKTEIAAGEEQDLVSVTKNKDPRKGVCDFQNGKLVAAEDGGSIIVDAIKISHSAGTAGQDAASKLFTQTTFTSDLENAVVQFHQNGKVLREVKISQFCFKGDEPQTVEAGFKKLDKPFVVLAGSDVKIKLVRPTGVAGAIAFLAIELDCMRTYPKRTS